MVPVLSPVHTAVPVESLYKLYNQYCPVCDTFLTPAPGWRAAPPLVQPVPAHPLQQPGVGASPSGGQGQAGQYQEVRRSRQEAGLPLSGGKKKEAGEGWLGSGGKKKEA